MRLLEEVRSLTGNYHAKSGMYHYHRGEFTQAVDFLRKALKDEDLAPADRRNARYYLTLALMDWAEKLDGSDDPEGGVEQLRAAAEVSPGYPDLYYRLGQLLERLERINEAIAAYRQALACQERYLGAHVALGFCLLRAGKEKASREAFEAARKIRYERIDEPFERATAALARGEVDEGARLLHDALVASTELCDEYVRKAQRLLKNDDFERALSYFDRALGVKPNYPDLHNFRGVTLCSMDRAEEAIDAFRASATLSPSFLVPRLNLAFTLIRVGDYKKAEEELESILELDPSEPAASAKLAELQSGRLPEKRRPVSRGSVR